MPLLSAIQWFGKRPARSTLLAGATSANGALLNPADFSPALSTRLLILQPTPFCNIACDYCYLPQRNSTARMSMATLRLTAERLRDDGLAAPELTVVWHAGEPLVMPRSWYDEAFGYLTELLGPVSVLTQSMQTNAMLIDDDWCIFFKRHGVRIGVSIDGPADLHDTHRRTRTGHGTHAHVTRGLARLREYGIPFHAIAVVTPATFAAAERFINFFECNPVSELGCNVDEAEGVHLQSSLTGHEAAHADFLRRLLAHGLRPGSALRVRELANALQVIARPLPTVRWHGNQPHVWPLNAQVLPFAMLNVAHDGRWSTFSPELLGQSAPAYNDFVFGNVHDAGYLRGSGSAAFRRVWGAVVQGTELCAEECAYFEYCGGGAPANKLYENGNLTSGETLYCRSMIKRPFDTVLNALETCTVANAREESTI